MAVTRVTRTVLRENGEYIEHTHRSDSAGDRIFGSADVDRCFGMGGNDRIYGRAGADQLFGGSGQDQLSGGSGADRLTGGAEADTFIFDTTLSSRNVDRITDFRRTDNDKIRLDDKIFKAVSGGKWSRDAFTNGQAASDAEDRIIYDRASGSLYYDADGSGAGTAVKFAVLKAGTALSWSDFVIF
jgi:Ca2+-binding RTX toxin-like protein